MTGALIAPTLRVSAQSHRRAVLHNRGRTCQSSSSSYAAALGPRGRRSVSTSGPTLSYMTDSDSLKLTEEQYSTLLDAKTIEDDGGEPAVVDQALLDNLSALLGEALEARYDLRNGSALPLEAAVEQLTDDGADGADLHETLADTSQHPETGGAGEDERDDDTVGVMEKFGALDSEDRREVRMHLSKAASYEDRLPGHSETLRRTAAETLSVDSLDDVLVLEESDEVPADPRHV